jgi:DNA mismatch repair ATPase MutS
MEMHNMKSELKSINEMTVDELEQLRANVTNTINKKNAEEAEKKKQEFFSGDRANELRDKIHELRKRYESFSKEKHKVTVSAELSLSLDTAYSSFDDLFDGYHSSFDPSDLFNVELESQLLNQDSFSKDMVQEINSRLYDATSDVCGEVVNLKPQLAEAIDAFTDEVNAILNELDNCEVEDEDIQKLLKPIKVAKKKATPKKGKK